MTRYEPAIDLGRIKAIDFHTHVEQGRHGDYSMDERTREAASKYFKNTQDPFPTVERLAEVYRELGMAAVVFTVDARTRLGRDPVSSEQIAEDCANHADVLIPFGSVDPHRGADAIDQAVRLVNDYGVLGFKFHPSVQGFAPNDSQFTPLWSRLEELGTVALFHTGQNGIGAGTPGGGGIKLRYSDPMLLDDVAADHPGLTVVLAHPSVPWQAEAISIATHKSNVYIDLSGWSPKYFPPELVRASAKMLNKKVLFATDFPMIQPERWLSDFAALEIPEDRQLNIFKSNAARILKLDGPK